MKILETCFLIPSSQGIAISAIFQLKDSTYLILGSIDNKYGLLLKVSKTGEEIWRNESFGKEIIIGLDDIIYTHNEKNLLILGHDIENNTTLFLIDNEGNIQNGWPKVFDIKTGVLGGNILDTEDGGYIIFGAVDIDNESHPGILKMNSEFVLEWVKNYTLPELSGTCTRGVRVKNGYLINCFLVYGWFAVLRIDNEGNQLYAESFKTKFSKGGIATNIDTGESYLIGYGYNEEKDQDDTVMVTYTDPKNGEAPVLLEYIDKKNVYSYDIVFGADNKICVLASMIENKNILVYSIVPQKNYQIIQEFEVNRSIAPKRIIKDQRSGYTLVGIQGENEIYFAHLDF